jgi:hypothetical protein
MRFDMALLIHLRRDRTREGAALRERRDDIQALAASN